MSRPLNIYSGQSSSKTESSSSSGAHDRFLKADEGTTKARPRARSFIGAGTLQKPEEKPLTTYEKFQRALVKEELKKFGGSDSVDTKQEVAEEPRSKPEYEAQSAQTSKPMSTHARFEQELRKEEMAKYNAENRSDSKQQSPEVRMEVVDDSHLYVRPKPKYHIPTSDEKPMTSYERFQKALRIEQMEKYNAENNIQEKGSEVQQESSGNSESQEPRQTYAQKTGFGQAQATSERMTGNQRFQMNLRQQEMLKYDQQGDQSEETK